MTSAPAAAGSAHEYKWEPGKPLPEKWLTPEQAAEYANCCSKKIYDAMALNQLEYRKPGGGRCKTTTRQWIDTWYDRFCRPKNWPDGVQ